MLARPRWRAARVKRGVENTGQRLELDPLGRARISEHAGRLQKDASLTKKMLIGKREQ